MCHKCDNPPCVNPDHLFIGTRRDNMQDAIAKGRFKFPTPRSGEANNKSKLTTKQASQIWHLYRAGMNVSDLSRKFGLARSTIREVINGRCWKDPSRPYVPKGRPTEVLTDEQREEIRALRKAGWTTVALGKRFGISQAHASKLTLGLADCRTQLGMTIENSQVRDAHGKCQSRYRYVPPEPVDLMDALRRSLRALEAVDKAP